MGPKEVTKSIWPGFPPVLGYFWWILLKALTSEQWAPSESKFQLSKVVSLWISPTREIEQRFQKQMVLQADRDGWAWHRKGWRGPFSKQKIFFGAL